MKRSKALIIESKCLRCSNHRIFLNLLQWTRITALSTRSNKQRKTTTTQSRPPCKTQQLPQQRTILIQMQHIKRLWCALMLAMDEKTWTSKIFTARSLWESKGINNFCLKLKGAFQTKIKWVLVVTSSREIMKHLFRGRAAIRKVLWPLIQESRM